MHHFVVTEIIDTMNWMYCSSFNIKIFATNTFFKYYQKLKNLFINQKYFVHYVIINKSFFIDSHFFIYRNKIFVDLKIQCTLVRKIPLHHFANAHIGFSVVIWQEKWGNWAHVVSQYLTRHSYIQCRLYKFCVIIDIRHGCCITC